MNDKTREIDFQLNEQIVVQTVREQHYLYSFISKINHTSIRDIWEIERNVFWIELMRDGKSRTDQIVEVMFDSDSFSLRKKTCILHKQNKVEVIVVALHQFERVSFWCLKEINCFISLACAEKCERNRNDCKQMQH